MTLAPFAEALAAASVDGMHAFDLDRRAILWNPAMERISGLSAARVLGRRASEVLRFTEGSDEDECHERALRGEASVSWDRAFAVVETGRRGWVDAHYRPFHDASGAVAGAIVVVRDLTESKLSAALLAETEQRFQKMADASPVLLWMAGLDSLCTFFNQTWITFTGRKLEEELGIGWAEGVHFEDLQRCLDGYEAAFSARRPFEMEYRLRRADGEYRWILDRGTPRQDPDGTFAGYIGSCTDITDRRALESELREKVRLRDEFLSIASHELRTPLSALRLSVDGLAKQAARGVELTAEERSRRVGTMRRSVERLDQLITRLLDASRLRAGSAMLDPQPLDLARAVREACERMQAEITGAGSTLAVDTEPTVGTWDREKIDQLIGNLLSNAAKYGEGKPIQVRVDGDATSARIVVRDEGIGIASEDQRRVFRRFERAVSSHSISGFGLGLWIANEIATASGGRIDVTSRPGAGSTFTVTLPR